LQVATTLSWLWNPFVFEGLHDFARFFSEFPQEKLGVLLDVGRLYQIGIELSEAVRLFNHKLLDVHIHDATLGGNVCEATNLPIGKGTINFPDFISVLRHAGYDGWLTLEIRGSEKEIVEGKDFLEA